MPEVLLDALLDTLKLLPFFFVIYIFIEFIESKSAARATTARLLSGKFSPVVASGLGLIPQCGFSVMATNLYDEGYIAAGTLLSVYIATSDEALPVLLSHTATSLAVANYIWQLLLIKFLYAVLVGFIANAVLRIVIKRRKPLEKIETADTQSVFTDSKSESTQNHPQTAANAGCCSHELEHEHKRTFWQFMRHPVSHTLKVAFYVLVINIAFGSLIYLIGGDKIAAFMQRAYFAQPFFAALIGLIPNCASAVLLTEMLLSGTLSFPAAVAGLCANSGIAVAVLFKNRSRLKGNLLILLTLYLSGVLLGLALSLFV